MYVIIYRYDVDPAQRERFMRQRGDDYHARNATTRDLYRDEWQIAALEIFHRSKENKDVIGAAFFHPTTVPDGFAVEMNIFPGDNPPPFPPVIIHHKFVVIDAETDSPVIYTGSANMSGNSVFKNDENLLEITGSPRLARIYLAEFLRLYEHYRARARFIAFKQSGAAPASAGFALRPDRKWADKHFAPGTPEFKARLRMLSIG